MYVVCACGTYIVVCYVCGLCAGWYVYMVCVLCGLGGDVYICNVLCGGDVCM